MTTEIEQLTTRAVYENPWMRLREDQVRFPGGHEGIYSVVDKPDFATIIPVLEDGRIQLVQQYRYPVSGRYWELPQGTHENDPDIDPTELAHCELQEETGLIADSMEKIGEIFAVPGLANQTCHMFVARGMTRGTINRDVTEQGMETDAFTQDEIIQMIRNGEIKDSTTIGVFGFWKMINEG